MTENMCPHSAPEVKWVGPHTSYLGDYVRVNGMAGRVYDVHHHCPEGDSWLRRQQLLDDPMSHKDDRWVSVLVHEGGSITVPDHTVEVVEPFELENNWSDFHFRPEGQ